MTERKDNPVSDTPAENGETVAAPVSGTAEEEVSASDTSARANRGASPVSDTAALERERDEYLDALQRLKAEFDNFRKRTAREHEAMSARANEALLRELLPIIDDLERALEAAEQHEEAKLEDGVRLVHRALADVARRHGLEEIETDGAFDPHVHEALLAQPAEDAESGSVLQVLQKGYRLGDRVLRPARVVVAE